MLSGAEIAGLSDEALAVQVQTVDAYRPPGARPEVAASIKALQSRGEVVGFLGDGINDAPALKVADIGLSVDGATGVAQAAADMILLAPDLEVVADGVEEGRRTFANILKYVRMGASSNFGNMLSMAVASLFLPFLPMLPTQILLNNLLYDFSEIGIPFDTVRPEATAQPQVWNMRAPDALRRRDGAAVVGLRHADLRRPAAGLPRRAGGVPHRLVPRIDGDADPGDLHHPHQRPALAQPAASRAHRVVAGGARGGDGRAVLADRRDGSASSRRRSR